MPHNFDSPAHLNMIYGVTDADRFLYHYTKAETAIERILPNRSFKVGSFSCTNDPRENKEFRFWLTAATNESLMGTSADELSTRFAKALQALAKVACFCTDTGPLSGDPISDISHRGLAKPRMWAQYAQDHKGVCLVFDAQRFAARIMAETTGDRVVCGDKVDYSDRIFAPSFEDQHYCINVDSLNRIGFENYAARHAYQFRRRLFFEKMSDWRDEREFRWIVLSPVRAALFIDYADSLVGVVIGEKTDQLETLLRLLPLSIQTTKLVWINGSPWYDFAEVRCQRDIREMQGLHSNAPA